jgi:hypothetical protein
MDDADEDMLDLQSELRSICAKHEKLSQARDKIAEGHWHDAERICEGKLSTLNPRTPASRAS